MTTLVFAPHADDETLGMGATIAQKAANDENVVVCVLTGFGETVDGEHPLWPREIWENVRSECLEACSVLGVNHVEFCELPAACLDTLPAHRINSVVAEVIRKVQPSEVYFPFAHDLHKDHGAVAYAVSVVCRPYLAEVRKVRRVLAYETLSETSLAPSYMVPAFEPNVFVDVSKTISIKLDALVCYKSQLQPDQMPRSIENVKAQARLRGGRIGVAAAEAFLLVGEYQK